MRLAAFILAALISTPATGQDSFATRSECLEVLEHALKSSRYAEQALEWNLSRLDGAPDGAAEHVEVAADAIRRRTQAMADYAEAVLLICQSYD